MSHEPADQNHGITDRNIERLLGEAYLPVEPETDFVARVRNSLETAAAQRREATPEESAGLPAWPESWPPHVTKYVGWGVAAALMVALVVSLVVTQSGAPVAEQDLPRDGSGQPVSGAPDRAAFAVTPPLDVSLRGTRWLSALKRPDPAQSAVTAAGETVKTGPRERRRVSLADGSVVYLNENTTLRTLADRHVAVDAGEIYLDVAPKASGGRQPPVVAGTTRGSRPALAEISEGTFIVETPARRLTALGTKFSVTVADKRTDVAVVQGRVRADQVTEPLAAGQRTSLASAAGNEAPEIEPAPRLAELLYWTRDLMAAAEPVLVPASGYAGGAVTVKSSEGVEEPLSLRRYHVDVHIEDGFARTTIDQTYFNHLMRREEGTFHFPLPPDASISRLAMYVNGKLMEGGMVERNEGRNVYESIRYRMQDPALLEWIDGTTFKMRVFPLEPREEKRIILSYSQPIETLGAQGRFRFPIGHSLNEVGKFSVHIRVHGGADGWNCATHELVAKQDAGDLVLDLQGERGASAPRSASGKSNDGDGKSTGNNGGLTHPARQAPTRLEGDLELTLTNRSSVTAPRFSSFTHEGHRYLMLRTAPELAVQPRPQRRDWIFVVEASSDRSPLLARAQIEIVRGMLSAAGHDDTFAVVSAGTRATRLTDTTTEPSPSPSQKGEGVLNTPANINALCDRLGQVHLIGALDLEAALVAAGDVTKGVQNPVIVHVGSGVPALGERSDSNLAAKIPSTAQYVGIAVGRSFNRTLMKIAAAGHRGYFTQINPNEPLAWRATDLVTTLNTPRVLSLAARAGEGDCLLTADALTRGETLCVLTRVPDNQTFPQAITLSGQLDGAAWTREIPVDAVANGAGYLPRQWARLEIDRLLAAGGENHRDEIVTLSKSMYVMSPFTSLLVLENEEMYAQYKVDRGRKDHWAMYPAPATIPVVREATSEQQQFDLASKAYTLSKAELEKKGRTAAELAQTIIIQSPYCIYAPPRPLSREERIEVQQKLAVLVDEFNTLREQRRFAEAEAKAIQAQDIAPDEAVTKLMWREVRFSRNVMNNPGMQGDLDVAFVNAMFYVERAGVSADSDPPLVFGDVREWSAMSDRRRRSSGFQPQFATLTSGATLSAGTVISSDRRYVRITALPFFSQVGPVNTFHVENSPAGLGGRVFNGTGNGFVGNSDGTTVQLPDFTFSNGDRILTENVYDGEWRLREMFFEEQRRADETSAVRRERHALINRMSREDERLNDERRSAIIATLFEVEKSFIPFPDEPPIVYPSREVWEELTIRRGKYASIELPQSGRGVPSPYRGLVENYFSPLGGEASSSGYYLSDDVQYFAPGPEFPLMNEAAAQRLRRAEAAAQRGGRRGSINVNTVDAGTYAEFQDGKSASELMRFALLPDLAGVIDQPALPQGSAFFELYTPPVLPSSYSLTDLLAYAPGMATNRLDIQSVLEAEGSDSLPKSGTVDPKAAELIAKARAAGWRSVELMSGGGKNSPVASAIPLTIRFDGTGRFQFEQTTVDGLKETVVCDGANLWHVYPELEVAAQRRFSRVYRGALCRMLPWLMPPVEDLAVGADVTAIDDRTVAISHAGIAQVKTQAGKPVRHVQLRLVFGASGQIEQQQLVDMPLGKVIVSLRFTADGAITVHDGNSKEIGRRVYKLALAGAPDVKAPSTAMVVVPLPLRTQMEIAAKAGIKADSDPATWDEQTAIATAAVAEGATARAIIQKRFFARGDFRLGLYTLLLKHDGAINFTGQPGGKDDKTVRHPLAVHLQSPLARYIADRIGGDEATRPSGAHPVLGEGLLAELDQYGALVQPLTRFAKLNETEQKAQLDILRRTSTEFVRKVRSPWLALHVGVLAEQNLKHRDVHLALADFWDRMGKQHGAGLAARCEKARQLHRAGEFTPARAEFLAYHRAALDADILPPIDQEFYNAVLRCENGWSSTDWQKLITETGETLRKRYGAAAMLPLAWQCRALGDSQQADALVAKALEAKEEKPQRRLATQFFVAEYYHRTNQIEKADGLVTTLISAWRAGGVSPPLVGAEKTGGSRSPLAKEVRGSASLAEARLLLWSARLADQRGRLAEAARREHQALELVYSTPPEKIDLNQLRTAFSGLMARYEKLVQATVLPGQEPPQELVGTIVAAADQWRSLDDTPDAACQSAARLLRTLGARDAAWQYLTTPLAGKAHESAPWVAMAAQLGSDGEMELAEQGYRAAWQSEPTNPQILLGHANLLRDNGRADDARGLYRQIATGQWQQPRFNSVQQEAQRELQALTPK